MSETYVDHVLVYQDEAQGWRWSAIAGNGEIVAQGESHTRPEDAARAARGVFGANVRILETEHRVPLQPLGPGGPWESPATPKPDAGAE